MPIRDYIIISASTLFLAVGYSLGVSAQKEPCFNDFSDAYHVAPFVEGYSDPNYGNLFKAMDRQNGNLVTTGSGVDVFVPTSCFLAEGDFTPTLWKKENKTGLFEFEAALNRVELLSILRKDLDFILPSQQVQ